MTAVRFYTDASRAGPLFRRSVYRQADRVRSSMRGAARDAADTIVALGQGDIARAGNFGSRWTDGLHADVTEGGGNIRINVTHDVPYWSVFEHGATIAGRPMLWIPLSFATDAQGKRARDFPGRLFRVDRKTGGAPLLLSAEDKEPKYFGADEVTIPKKFHLTEITRSIAQRFADIYRARFQEGEEA